MRHPMTRKEFGIAYEKGRSQTENFLISRGLQVDEAKEKAQAAWARGWERRFQIKDKTKALAWINTIALNLYRSTYRKDLRHDPMFEFPVQDEIDVSVIDLHKKLYQCKKKERQLLMLRYFLGIDIKDLANRYQCTETAMRVKLLRARKSLKTKFMSL
jgi:DNA-directed RNA polymerase specialized sigma24 family protein